MVKKTYAILGLGVFGSSIAKELSQYDHEVIAIDKEMTRVEKVSEFVSQAVRADFTDIEQLRSVGVQDCDVAIVATGSHLEESIMAVLNLKELKIPSILAKAQNDKYEEVLLKVGADRVVRPEKEMGERVAKRLLSENIVDIIDLDDDYSIVEIVPLTKWDNKSLKELNLRAQYGINVIGIRKKESSKLSLNLTADTMIKKEDRLLIVADDKIFTYLNENK